MKKRHKPRISGGSPEKQYGIPGGFRVLAAAVLSRALTDLGRETAAIRINDHTRKEARAWINSSECETFCYALDVDYRTIREKAAGLYRRWRRPEAASASP